jgi:hypothetical protein
MVSVVEIVYLTFQFTATYILNAIIIYDIHPTPFTYTQFILFHSHLKEKTSRGPTVLNETFPVQWSGTTPQFMIGMSFLLAHQEVASWGRGDVACIVSLISRL